MWTHEVLHNDGPGRWFLDAPEAEVLSREVERRMLLELADCAARLLQATRRPDGSEWGSTVGDAEFQQVVRDLADAGTTTDPHSAALRATARRHQEIRTALALANSRLVAHLAKRFSNQGIAIADLIQDGFCGLLMAIDRFDTANTTRLATYAGWWIRQAMQQTIAGGAYPVRLNPIQLRRLRRAIAQCPAAPAELPAASPHAHGGRSATTWCELAALRPTVPLDAPCRTDDVTPLTDFLATTREPDANPNEAVELLRSLLGVLTPREQVVLTLRFGLDGQPRHSLNQVSEVLAVSKERVRQIEERALEKLRVAAAERDGLGPSPARDRNAGEPLAGLSEARSLQARGNLKGPSQALRVGVGAGPHPTSRAFPGAGPARPSPEQGPAASPSNVGHHSPDAGQETDRQVQLLSSGSGILLAS
jgi:RNA polymerase primary sigma factor